MDYKPKLISDFEQKYNITFKSINIFNPDSFLIPSFIEPQSAYYFVDSEKSLKAIKIQGYELQKTDIFQRLVKFANDLNILNLTNCYITDASFLAKLTNLTALNLSNNEITNLGILNNLRNLKRLILDNVPIEKNLLLQLPKLRRFSAENSKIEDLQLILNCPNLVELDLSNNQLKTIDGIEKLSKLVVLNLSNNKIVDTDKISNLQNLEILRIDNNELTVFPTIDKLPKLTVCSIVNNKITIIPNELKNTNCTINAQKNPFRNIYLFQDPPHPSLNIVWYAGKMKSVIEDLKNEKGSMIGIFGKWGRGKSYFWKILKEKLEKEKIKKNNKYEIIEFIAWKYNDTQAIQAYLYETIASKYFKKPDDTSFCSFLRYNLKTFYYSICRHKEKFFFRLFILVIIPVVFSFIFRDSGIVQAIVRQVFGEWWLGVGFGFSYFAIIAYVFTQASRLNIANIFKELSLTNFEQFLGLQAAVEKELQIIFQKWKKQVILFVDDLDRCNEEKILQIIDSLRVMTDNKYISQKLSIITAIDERILKRVIYNKYKSIVEKNELDILSREYIEKLFIFSFKLPNLLPKDRKDIFDAYTRNQQLILGITKQINTKEYKPTSIIEISDFQNLSSILEKEDLTPRQIRNIYNRYLLALEILFSAYDLNFEEKDEQKIKKIILSLVIGFSLNKFSSDNFKEAYQSDEEKKIKKKILEEEYELIAGDWQKFLFAIEHVIPF